MTGIDALSIFEDLAPLVVIGLLYLHGLVCAFELWSYGEILQFEVAPRSQSAVLR